MLYYNRKIHIKQWTFFITLMNAGDGNFKVFFYQLSLFKYEIY